MWRVVDEACVLSPGLLDAVHGEALRRDGVGWVLGPDLAAPRGFPAARTLDQALREQLPALLPDQLRFSFLKFSTHPTPPDDSLHTDAYHVDTHDDLRPGVELRRVLLNLGVHPRRVRLGRCDRAALVLAELLTPGDYAVRGLPRDVEVDMATLAAYDGHRVAALEFWPSVIPHVGIEDGPYTLVSYEGVERRG